MATGASDGTWSLLDALYVFAINSTANANLNWVSSSFGATKVGSVSFSANNGYTGDGSTGYFTTGYNPTTAAGSFTLNSAHVSGCVLTSRTAAFGYGIIGGANTFNTPPSIDIDPNNTGPAFYGELNAGNFPSYSGAGNAQGSWIVTRTAGAGLTYYRNGTSVATPSDASTGLANFSVVLLAYNNGGTIQSFSADQIAYVSAGGGFNSTQANNFYSRMHTYLQTIGETTAC